MIKPGDLIKISVHHPNGVVGHFPLVRGETGRPSIIIPGHSIMLYLGFDEPWSDLKMQNMSRVMWREMELVIKDGYVVPVDEDEAG